MKTTTEIHMVYHYMYRTVCIFKNPNLYDTRICNEEMRNTWICPQTHSARDDLKNLVAPRQQNRGAAKSIDNHPHQLQDKLLQVLRLERVLEPLLHHRHVNDDLCTILHISRLKAELI